MPPRAVLISRPPGLISPSSAAPIMPRVCADRGQWIDTMSLSAISVGRSTFSAPRAATASVSWAGSQASTRHRKSARISAIRVPICPIPTSPTVRPYSSVPNSRDRSAAVPAAIASLASGMRFSSVRMKASACSATASALPPDWLQTATPARVQASTSTVSYPAP